MKTHGKPNMLGASTSASQGKSSNITGAHAKASHGRSTGRGPARSGDSKGAATMSGGKAGNHAAMRRPYK